MYVLKYTTASSPHADIRSTSLPAQFSLSPHLTPNSATNTFNALPQHLPPLPRTPEPRRPRPVIRARPHDGRGAPKPEDPAAPYAIKLNLVKI